MATDLYTREHRQLAIITGTNTSTRTVQANANTGVSFSAAFPKLPGGAVYVPRAGEVWWAVQDVTQARWRLDGPADETTAVNTGLEAAQGGDLVVWPAGRLIAGDSRGVLVGDDGMIDPRRLPEQAKIPSIVLATVTSIDQDQATIDATGPDGETYTGVAASAGLYQAGATAWIHLTGDGTPVYAESALRGRPDSATTIGGIPDLAAATAATVRELATEADKPYGKMFAPVATTVQTAVWTDITNFTQEPIGKTGLTIENGRFVCGRPGIYRLSCGARFAGASSMVGVVVRIQGIDLLPSEVLVSPSRPAVISSSTLHTLAAGDRVGLAVYHNTGQAINVLNGWIEAEYVRTLP